jgi:hypothetical protein
MKIPRQFPLKLIRKQCLYCCCRQFKTIRFCADTGCHLWYLRFGVYPKTAIKLNGKKWEQLFDKENFKKGKKFCPDKYVDEYRL